MVGNSLEQSDELRRKEADSAQNVMRASLKQEAQEIAELRDAAKVHPHDGGEHLDGFEFQN